MLIWLPSHAPPWANSISWTLMTMTQLNPALLSSENFWIARRRRSEICSFFSFYPPQQKHRKKQKHEQKNLDLKNTWHEWNVHSNIVNSMISTNSFCFLFLIVSFVGSDLEPLMANISELRDRAQLHHVFQGQRSVLPLFWLENVQLKLSAVRQTRKEALEVLKMFSKGALTTNGPWRGMILPSYMGIEIIPYKGPY